jgi:hypothetical protein
MSTAPLRLYATWEVSMIKFFLSALRAKGSRYSSATRMRSSKVFFSAKRNHNSPISFPISSDPCPFWFANAAGGIRKSSQHARGLRNIPNVS